MKTFQASEDFTRYVILLHPIPDKTAADVDIKGHICFLRELEKQNRYVLGGPFMDGSGGMVIIKAASLEEAQSIAEEDPFVSRGLRRFEIKTWKLSCEENQHLGRG